MVAAGTGDRGDHKANKLEVMRGTARVYLEVQEGRGQNGTEGEKPVGNTDET